MRWLKHLTSAHDDERTASVLEEFGPEGYGIWWLLLEQIGASMEAKSNRCELTYFESRWCRELHCSARRLRKVLKSFADLGLISFEVVENKIKIAIPKLLKYRDEYSKKSGVTPDKLPSRAEAEAEAHTEADTQADNPAACGPVLLPPKSTPKPAGDVGDWPLSAAKIRGYFPKTKDRMVMEVVNASVAVKREVSDLEISLAVASAKRRSDAKTGQNGPGLFKFTVPEEIGRDPTVAQKSAYRNVRDLKLPDLDAPIITGLDEELARLRANLPL